jgi:hypothetical protein
LITQLHSGRLLGLVFDPGRCAEGFRASPIRKRGVSHDAPRGHNPAIRGVLSIPGLGNEITHHTVPLRHRALLGALITLRLLFAPTELGLCFRYPIKVIAVIHPSH